MKFAPVRRVETGIIDARTTPKRCKSRREREIPQGTCIIFIIWRTPMLIKRKERPQPAPREPEPPGPAPEIEEPFSDESSFAVIEASQMPSKFLPYPEGTRISYRPYTWGEIDAYNESKFSVAASLEKMLDGVETVGVAKRDITVADALWLANLRRLSTFKTNEFTVTVAHEMDGSRHTSRFSLEDMDFKFLDVPALPIEVDVVCLSGSGKSVLRKQTMRFMPLTVGMYAELESKTKDIKSRHVMAAQCVDMDYEDALRTINDSTQESMLVLQEVDALLKHEVAPVTVKYEVRGEEYSRTVEIDDPHSLVRPFRRRDVSKKHAIRFGVS